MAKTKHADKNNPQKKHTNSEKVRAMADKAEAAAAKKAAAATPKIEKPAKVKKADSNLPMDEDNRRLFLQLLPGISAQKAAVATAVAELRNLYKKAKGDGFDKADFDLAEAIQTAEGEAKEKAKIVRKTTIAKYCGKALGQLDFFAEPDRTPAAETAFDEGVRDCMGNKSAKPGYDPSTEQYRQYMAGYHQEQEKQLKGGITKPEPVAPVTKAIPGPETAPHSGMGMTRADYVREQRKAEKLAAEQAAAASQPSTPIDVVHEEDEAPPSAFRKKEPA